MYTRAPEFSALMTVFRSTGPVISTRLSRSPGESARRASRGRMSEVRAGTPAAAGVETTCRPGALQEVFDRGRNARSVLDDASAARQHARRRVGGAITFIVVFANVQGVRSSAFIPNSGALFVAPRVDHVDIARASRGRTGRNHRFWRKAACGCRRPAVKCHVSKRLSSCSVRGGSRWRKSRLWAAGARLRRGDASPRRSSRRSSESRRAISTDRAERRPLPAPLLIKLADILRRSEHVFDRR